MLLVAGSPSHTPTSASSLQEMVFTYQGGQSGSSDKSPECQPPASRRRRASMQDALDHTKINARLYEQIVSAAKQNLGFQVSQHKKASNHHANLPLEIDYCPSASEGDNESVRSSALVASRCFPGGYNVKLYISRGRLAWWLLAFLHSDST